MYRYSSTNTNLQYLKVHKNENFFGFDFDFCIVSLLVMLIYEGFVKKLFLIWPLWGEVGLFRVVLRLRGMKIIFNLGQKIVFFLSCMTPLYLLIIVFPKFDPLTVKGMSLCVDFGPKCQNLFCLV
jgi:hypothetical protein